MGALDESGSDAHSDGGLDHLFEFQVERRGLPGDESVFDLEVLTAAEFAVALTHEHDHVALVLERQRAHLVDVVYEPDEPHSGRRVDGLAEALVVEAHVAAGHGDPERLARVRHAANRLVERVEDLGLLGVAEVEAVGDCRRLAAGARHVARGFDQRYLSAHVRIEVAVAAVAVTRYRDGATCHLPTPGVADTQHRRVAARQHYRVHHDLVVVLLPYP